MKGNGKQRKYDQKIRSDQGSYNYLGQQATCINRPPFHPADKGIYGIPGKVPEIDEFYIDRKSVV